MTCACITAGAAAAIALIAMGTGFYQIACKLDEPVVRFHHIAIGSAEIFGGVVIWVGLFSVLGGYL